MLSERFWRKVDRGSADECWPWLGSKHRKGYGQFKIDGRVNKAHRVAWQLAESRPVAEGFVLDHLCRNPSCVNPDHLEEVRPAANTLRGESFAAVNARKTHCANGHEFTEENTSIRPSGARRCRACVAAYNERQRVTRDKATGRYTKVGKK